MTRRHVVVLALLSCVSTGYAQNLRGSGFDDQNLVNKADKFLKDAKGVCVKFACLFVCLQCFFSLFFSGSFFLSFPLSVCFIKYKSFPFFPSFNLHKMNISFFFLFLFLFFFTLCICENQKPCLDAVGNTEISIAGKPATCAQLAPYCKYAQFKKRVSKVCPKTCGICNTESDKQGGKSALAKAGSHAIKPCEDTVGETDINIRGKPATCVQLAPYCNYPQFRERVAKHCPKTCGECNEKKTVDEGNKEATKNNADAGQSGSSAAKPCKDIEGETDISIAGKPATCAQLAPYCKYAQFKEQVSKSCPKTCGACKDVTSQNSVETTTKLEIPTLKLTTTKLEILTTPASTKTTLGAENKDQTTQPSTAINLTIKPAEAIETTSASSEPERPTPPQNPSDGVEVKADSTKDQIKKKFTQMLDENLSLKKQLAELKRENEKMKLELLMK